MILVLNETLYENDELNLSYSFKLHKEIKNLFFFLQLLESKSGLFNIFNRPFLKT